MTGDMEYVEQRRGDHLNTSTGLYHRTLEEFDIRIGTSHTELPLDPISVAGCVLLGRLRVWSSSMNIHWLTEATDILSRDEVFNSVLQPEARKCHFDKTFALSTLDISQIKKCGTLRDIDREINVFSPLHHNESKPC